MRPLRQLQLQPLILEHRSNIHDELVDEVLLEKGVVQLSAAGK